MRSLGSSAAQAIYAEQNFEYPVPPTVEISDTVKSFGDIKLDNLPLAEIGRYRKVASEVGSVA